MGKIIDKFLEVKDWLCNEVGADKYLHILVCLVLAFVVCKVCKNESNSTLMVCLLSYTICMAVGIFKELLDNSLAREFCLEDVIADGIGAMIGIVLFLI